MITFRKVTSSIVTKLKKCCPGIKVQTSDIEEGIERPCFFIDIKNIALDNLMGNFSEKEIMYDILYFPKDKKNNAEDILEKMSQLDEGFNDDNTIEIDENFLAEAENVKLFEVDKVLHLTFEIKLSEEYIRAEKELMETIEVKGGVNANK